MIFHNGIALYRIDELQTDGEHGAQVSLGGPEFIGAISDLSVYKTLASDA